MQYTEGVQGTFRVDPLRRWAAQPAMRKFAMANATCNAMGARMHMVGGVPDSTDQRRPLSPHPDPTPRGRAA